jgi:hydroxymethylglutaryl-CoA reductase
MNAMAAARAHEAYEAHEEPSSRISGFYKLPIEERLLHVRRFGDLTDEDVATLTACDSLGLAQADRMIENVGGLFHLPVGFAANFRIDDRDLLVPMVIEEPSVVAAASNAARLLREGRGIETSATDPIMIGQIQVCDVPDLSAARAAVERCALALVDKANRMQPRLFERGGGARAVRVHEIPATPWGPTSSTPSPRGWRPTSSGSPAARCTCASCRTWRTSGS